MTLAYWVAVIPWTFTDLKCYLCVAGLFKCDFFVMFCSSWQHFTWCSILQSLSAIIAVLSIICNTVSYLCRRWTSCRELLEQIKNFEEQELAGIASRDSEFKPRLQPLNESGGSALLKIVRIVFHMIFRLYSKKGDIIFIAVTHSVLNQFNNVLHC